MAHDGSIRQAHAQSENRPLHNSDKEKGVMPPHCDSLDGPVVTAARRALDEGDVAIVLPYVSTHAEPEIAAAFEQVLPIDQTGGSAGDLADRWFFETVVRLHRAEGAPYTGLKPAGQDEGPVIPVAERALHTGSADELVHVLTETVADQAKTRLDQATASSSTSTDRWLRRGSTSRRCWACRCGHTSCTWPQPAAPPQSLARSQTSPEAGR